MSDGRKQDRSQRGRAKKNTTADPAEAREEGPEKQEEPDPEAKLEQRDISAETQSRMESGGTEMAENARETFETARDTFRQGAEQAKDSMERGAGEVTNTLGRIAEISTEYVRRIAEVYVDTFEKMAMEMLNLQSKAAEWMRGTPVAPLYEAQARAGRKFVEATTSSSRKSLAERGQQMN